MCLRVSVSHSLIHSVFVVRSPTISRDCQEGLHRQRQQLVLPQHQLSGVDDGRRQCPSSRQLFTRRNPSSHRLVSRQLFPHTHRMGIYGDERDVLSPTEITTNEGEIRPDYTSNKRLYVDCTIDRQSLARMTGEGHGAKGLHSRLVSSSSSKSKAKAILAIALCCMSKELYHILAILLGDIISLSRHEPRIFVNFHRIPFVPRFS